MTEEKKTLLVIGGGFSGLTAAVEAAETGHHVIIVEKNPYLGGRVAQMNKYFWKLCPPACGLEIQYKRMKNNPRFTIYTMAEVEKITGSEGNFEVTVKLHPRHVNDKCTACNKCAEVCDVERSSDFDFGMRTTKAAYLPYNQAFPMQYVIDDKFCKGSSCNKCVQACAYQAIDLSEKPRSITVKAGAIIAATGWTPYDANRIDNLGFGQVKNVITNMMMERLAAPNGPTGGKLLRPSDQKEVKNIAFVQCAGSRDENHLAHCSYVCCLASIKQATYVRDQFPDSKAQIFYIDMRTPGLYENRFLAKAQSDSNIVFTKGKVAKVTEDPATGDVIVTAEDILGGGKIEGRFDMLVLATGMEASGGAHSVAAAGGFSATPDGFVDPAAMPKGVFAVGTLKTPVDVARSAQDATGMVMKGIQSMRRK